MFDAAASMDDRQLNSVAYYTRLALERRYTPEDLRKYPILAGLSGEPSQEEQETACAWLEEIQLQEGCLINQIDYNTLERYIGEVIGLSRQRSEAAAKKYDRAETQRILENLRRAVPSPAEEIWMRMRKAG